ncbi:hypothetical protein Tco_1207561 [Tanacetum coccineum]
MDSTISSIQPNVELASNIVTKSSLGDCIFDVGMTDNSVDVDPGIGGSNSTRESRSTGRIHASWKLLVATLNIAIQYVTMVTSNVSEIMSQDKGKIIATEKRR